MAYIALNIRWLEFNDSKVSSATSRKLSSVEAYVLLYKVKTYTQAGLPFDGELVLPSEYLVKSTVEKKIKLTTPSQANTNPPASARNELGAGLPSELVNSAALNRASPQLEPPVDQEKVGSGDVTILPPGSSTPDPTGNEVDNGAAGTEDNICPATLSPDRTVGTPSKI